MARKHVYEFGNTAFLQGAGAAVVMTEDVGFLEDKKFTVTTVIPAKGSTVAKKVILSLNLTWPTAMALQYFAERKAKERLRSTNCYLTTLRKYFNSCLIAII